MKRLLTIAITVMAANAAMSWEALTPGGGGIFTDIAASDLVPGRMYLSSDVAGLMRSDSYGANWINVSAGLGSQYIQGIAVSPNKYNGVYIAISDGVYYSGDTGNTWTRLGVTGPDNRSLDRLPGEAIPKGRYATPSDICVVHDNGTNVIYVGTGHLSGDKNSTNDVSTLWVSRDDGATFTNQLIIDSNDNLLFASSTPIYSVLSRSAAPHEVWISTGEGIFQSTNYGQHWTQKNAGLPHLNARQMMCNHYSTHELAVVLESYGTNDSGVYYFDPYQQKWLSMTGNLPLTVETLPGETRKIKYRFIDGDRRSFGNPTTYRPATVIVGSGEKGYSDGYYMTTDRGATWTKIAENDEYKYNPNDGVDSNWFDPDVRGWMIYYDNTINFTGDIYIGGDHRMLRSIDGGATFEDIVSVRVYENDKKSHGDTNAIPPYASILRPDSWSGAGETDDMVVRKVAVDPFDPNHMYICAADNVLFRSNDQGKSWRQIGLCIRNTWCGDSHGVVFDPVNQGTVYALAAAGYSSNHGEGAIFKSTDYGDTWDLMAGTTNKVGNLPGHEIQDLVFGPADVNGNFTMFASLYQSEAVYGSKTSPAGHESGVWKSDATGTNWTFVGMADMHVRPITVTPNGDTLLFAGVTGGTNECGVWRMKYKNGAWSEVRKLTNQCWEVHSADYMTYYAATDQGIFKSTDQGVNWSKMSDPTTSQMGAKDAKYFGLCTDPADPDRLYVSLYGNNASIWRTDNGGYNWHDITFGHDNPRAMCLLRADQPRTLGNGTVETVRWLYSATQGSGLHRLNLRYWE